MLNRSALSTIITAVVLFCSTAAFSQDAHYWNLQYGTKSTLLGGAVIGSVEDIGATYYNPGMLAFLERAEFILSAKVYEYRSLTVTGGAGDGLDLTSSKIQASPSMVAGSFTFGWLGEHKLAYSILTRQKADFEINARHVADQDVLTDVPGTEFFAAGFTATQDMDDIWVGLSWGHRLGRSMSVGITQYVSIRSQALRTQLLAEALSDSGDVATLIDIQDFSYKNYGLVWKAGWGIDLDPVTLGLTVTTPTAKLSGSGNAITNLALTGVDTDGDDIPDPVLAGDFQEGVDAWYRTPWSVGAGVRFTRGDLKLHASAEYFAPVDAYNVMDIEPFIAQSSGDTIYAPLREQLEDVLNWGVGIEFGKREHWKTYASFVTDYSAAGSTEGINHSIASWDIYHTSLGGIINFNRTEITLGLAYAFANDTIEAPVDFDDSDDSGGLRGGGEADVRLRRLKLIFGFSIGI